MTGLHVAFWIASRSEVSPHHRSRGRSASSWRRRFSGRGLATARGNAVVQPAYIYKEHNNAVVGTGLLTKGGGVELPANRIDNLLTLTHRRDPSAIMCVTAVVRSFRPAHKMQAQSCFNGTFLLPLGPRACNNMATTRKYISYTLGKSDFTVRAIRR